MKAIKASLAIIGYAAMAALVGCNNAPLEPTPQYEVNQTKRIEMFKLCMDSLPPGPQSTQYNDWDEVVSECGSQAYYLAMECVANCKTKEPRHD